MDVLKKHREIGMDLLFPSNPDPNKAFDYKKQWANCLKAANIQKFRWHDMLGSLEQKFFLCCL